MKEETQSLTAGSGLHSPPRGFYSPTGLRLPEQHPGLLRGIHAPVFGSLLAVRKALPPARGPPDPAPPIPSLPRGALHPQGGGERRGGGGGGESGRAGRPRPRFPCLGRRRPPPPPPWDRMCECMPSDPRPLPPGRCHWTQRFRTAVLWRGAGGGGGGGAVGSRRPPLSRPHGAPPPPPRCLRGSCGVFPLFEGAPKGWWKPAPPCRDSVRRNSGPPASTDPLTDVSVTEPQGVSTTGAHIGRDPPVKQRAFTTNRAGIKIFLPPPPPRRGVGASPHWASPRPPPRCRPPPAPRAPSTAAPRPPGAGCAACLAGWGWEGGGREEGGGMVLGPDSGSPQSFLCQLITHKSTSPALGVSVQHIRLLPI